MALRRLAATFLRRPPGGFSGSFLGGGVLPAAPRLQRSYWQEVVRGTIDPATSTNRYEDPENSAQRSARAQNAEGLLRRQSRYRRYEKPWMRKKRLANERRFRNQRRGVEELTMYIRFVQEHSADRKE